MLQSYLKWASKSGSGCRWDDDFTFKFGNARLEIEDIEKLVVKVDGAEIKDVGKNTVIAVVDSIGISEDNTGEKIDVLGNDKVNYLVKDLKLERAPLLGTVTLIKPTLQNGSIDENANNWYFKYSPDNAYQYLKEGEPATESFTYKVTDAKGASATGTVNINITGVNDDAQISGTTSGSVTEKGSSNGNGTPQAIGELTASDIDNPPDPENPAKFRVVTDQESISKYGKYSITADGEWTYKLNNDNASVEALVENGTLPDSFTVYSIDGTPQIINIQIKGADDGELIGDSLTKHLTEDKDVDSQGRIVFRGTLLISDAANQVANPFISGAQNHPNNIGTIGLNEAGQYFYGIANIRIQFLGEGKQHTDSFILSTRAGSQKTIYFVTTGVNDKPLVKELGLDGNKYAGSANVEELINLYYKNPDIAAKAALGGDYDYLHVRTGQFLVSDVDVGDKLTVSNKPTKPDEKIGNLETEILQVKDSGGNPIVGKYVVNWTYTVKDSELDPLDKGVDRKPTKDQKFTVTIGDGTATVDTEVVLHLFGRDEIEFIDGENNGNNVIKGTIEDASRFNNPGNDVIYLDDGFDLAAADDGSDVIYAGNGGGAGRLEANDSVIFGGDGNDNASFVYSSDNGLFFGGNGFDIIAFINRDTTEKNYSWGGNDSDLFFVYLWATPQSNSWVMDFNFSPTEKGGDKITFYENDLNESFTPQVWNPLKTQLVSHTADDNHPFLSDGATYYELLVQSNVNSNDLNWYSLLNLVGTNGTAITLDGLFANGNLNPIEIL
jgi:VCBS repeat-containing protein